MPKIVQQIDKLSNRSFILGLRNGANIAAYNDGSGIIVNKVRIGSSTFANDEAITKGYLDNAISGFLQANGLTVSGSGSNGITISAAYNANTHAITVTGAHNQIATTPNANGTFNNGDSVVVGLTADGFGHITGYETKILNFASYSGWNLKGSAADPSISVGSGSTVAIVGDTYITATASETADGTNPGIILAHAAKAVTQNSTNTVDVVPGSATQIPVRTYNFDGAGHAANFDVINYTINIPAVTVSNGSAVSGQYVTAISASNHGISVVKTPALTDLNSVTGNESILPTSQAVKNYIDQRVSSSDAMRYKGTVSSEEGLTATQAGDTYKATAVFTLSEALSATGAAVSVYVGDMLIFNTEGKYDVIPSGNDGNVTAAAALASGNIIVGNGAHAVKDSGVALPENPVFTDTKTTITGSGVISVANSSTASADIFAISHGVSGVTAGEYGTNAAISTLTFDIPSIQVTEQGHISAAANVSVNLTSAVNAAITAAAYTSTDFNITGKTINLHSTEAADRLYKSTDGHILTWGGTDIQIGTSTSKKSVATKIATTGAGKVLIGASDGNYEASEAAILRTADAWAADDTHIPTAGAIQDRINDIVSENVPVGVVQVIRIAATTADATSTNNIPASSYLKRIVVKVTGAYTGATGSVIQVGDTVVATDGVDYDLAEVANYIIEPYTQVAASGKLKISLGGGTGSGVAVEVYAEYIAQPIL